MSYRAGRESTPGNRLTDNRLTGSRSRGSRLNQGHIDQPAPPVRQERRFAAAKAKTRHSRFLSGLERFLEKSSSGFGWRQSDTFWEQKQGANLKPDLDLIENPPSAILEHMVAHPDQYKYDCSARTVFAVLYGLLQGMTPAQFDPFFRDERYTPALSFNSWPFTDLSFIRTLEKKDMASLQIGTIGRLELTGQMEVGRDRFKYDLDVARTMDGDKIAPTPKFKRYGLFEQAWTAEWFLKRKKAPKPKDEQYFAHPLGTFTLDGMKRAFAKGLLKHLRKFMEAYPKWYGDFEKEFRWQHAKQAPKTDKDKVEYLVAHHMTITKQYQLDWSKLELALSELRRKRRSRKPVRGRDR